MLCAARRIQDRHCRVPRSLRLRCWKVPDGDRRAGGNVVAIAYDGDEIRHADLQARANDLQKQHSFKYPLPEMLDDRRIVTSPPEVDPLVDDFAPVEMLKSIERHNQGVDTISQPVAQ